VDIRVESLNPALDGLAEVKQSKSVLDKFPFNVVEPFLKVKLREDTWNVLEFCFFPKYR